MERFVRLAPLFLSTLPCLTYLERFIYLVELLLLLPTVSVACPSQIGNLH